MTLIKTVFHLASILSKFKNFAKQIKRRIQKILKKSMAEKSKTDKSRHFKNELP